MQSHNEKIQFLAAPNIGKPFYYYSNTLFFKDFGNCNDTIWKITGLNVEPYAYVNMGKYKLPFKYKMEISNEAFKKYGENYCYVTLIGEDHTYLYFFVNNWKGNKNNCYMMFDKQTKTEFVLKNGFNDDIHKGANIYISDISEDYYIGYIDAEELLDLEYDDETILSPQYKQLLSNTNKNVTQFIILCHRK
jgi:hypothetical protein